MFADRARQADAHVDLSGEAGAAVARLVARLDGMPLAIELAAARVESLGVAQLLDRIDDRFALLAGGDRLAAPRQRSLAATVEWSYRLLSEDERQVFRRLAVFPGPFTLEAAETVAGAGAGPAVLHLVDCSLLAPPRTGPGRPGPVPDAGDPARLRAASGWPRPASSPGPRPGWPGTRCRWPSRPRPACRQAPVSWPLPCGWMPRTPTTQQALAWALEHDPGTALRLAMALTTWWRLRGRGGDRIRAAARRCRAHRTGPGRVVCRTALAGLRSLLHQRLRRCARPLHRGP